MAKQITVFTDGSSLGNPGPGGWGTVLLFPNGKIAELGGHERQTTNNRMELAAAVEALQYIQKRTTDAEKADVGMHVDSAYVLNGITAWVYGWEKNGWKTKAGEPVLNQDLWQSLIEIVRRVKLSRDIIWTKVSGHSGVIGNERADTIATSFAAGERILLFTGSQEDYERLFGHTIEKKSEDAEKAESKKRNKTKAYSYVSLVKGTVRIDQTWDACKARVAGMKGAKYQKSISKEDEGKLVEKFSNFVE